MIRATVKPKNRKRNHYDDATDPMWKLEVEALLPWINGKGVDIGCGDRTLDKDIVRCDIDEKLKPDVLCSGDDTPFKDGEFDFVMSVHSFEHFADPYKMLKEWLRIVKKGGTIGIVHPDITFTKKQNPEIDNKGLRENPYNKHYFEHDLMSFHKKISEWEDLPFKIIDYGVACGEWSFYVILKKT